MQPARRKATSAASAGRAGQPLLPEKDLPRGEQGLARACYTGTQRLDAVAPSMGQSLVLVLVRSLVPVRCRCRVGGCASGRTDGHQPDRHK